MKRDFLSTLILFVYLGIVALFVIYVVMGYNLDKRRQVCYKSLSSSCINQIRYDNIFRDIFFKNTLKFDLAQAYCVEKDFKSAQEALDYVIRHEKFNRKLINLAKNKRQELQTLKESMQEADENDTGDYFNKDENWVRWEKPREIKVFINDNTERKQILKSAFSIWSSRMKGVIRFIYVDNENEANITIKCVPKIDDKHAGVTNYQTIKGADGKHYMYKVKTTLSLKRNDGSYYTDENLLSSALHEVGHGLGINYHSENKNDIMYSTTDTYKLTNISNRDVNTLKMIYR